MTTGARLVVVAIAAIPLALVATIHVDATARLTAAGGSLDGLLRTHALLAAAAAMLSAGLASWWLGRRPTRSPTDDSAARSQSASAGADVGRLRDELGAALAREREFSGHLAHELRTPLAVLRTGLELSRRRQASLEPDDRLDELLETVDDMGRLVNDLLMLARLGGAEPARRTPVAMRAVVEATWRRLEAKARARELAFEDRLPDDFTIAGDRDKLQIVLQNLLGNAVSYTERGGAIAVSSPRPDVVWIWDSGPQLAPDQLHRVFDRMWRADPARTDATQHAGLGLSLARALCENMGLRLGVENVASGGLAFVIAPAA